MAGLVAQPVAAALVLSLSALLCAYLFTGLRAQGPLVTGARPERAILSATPLKKPASFR